MIQDINLLPRSRTHVGLKIFLLLVLIMLLGAVAGSLYIFVKIKRPMVGIRSQAGTAREFEIRPGESVRGIAERLEDQDLISSALALRSYAAISGLASKLQAGRYRLSPSMNIEQIVRTFAGGEVVQTARTVTFPEGLRAEEYGQRLARAGLVSSAEWQRVQKNFSKAAAYAFLADRPPGRDLEGYLFPDTYTFAAEGSPEEIVATFLKNFDKKLDQRLRQEIKRQRKSIFEIITLASIIEGEVGRIVASGSPLTDADRTALARERRLVASVFYNRLKVGQALESDATIEYVTRSGRSRATTAETKLDSLYNTYRYPGLPPGPINNPSLDSIQAAVYPAQSDYFYFLSKPSGEAVFARTLQEHNENKRKYLK